MRHKPSVIRTGQETAARRALAPVFTQALLLEQTAQSVVGLVVPTLQPWSLAPGSAAQAGGQGLPLRLGIHWNESGCFQVNEAIRQSPGIWWLVFLLNRKKLSWNKSTKLIHKGKNQRCWTIILISSLNFESWNLIKLRNLGSPDNKISTKELSLLTILTSLF